MHWLWVKGHAGNPGNERADALANQGMAEAVAARARRRPASRTQKLALARQLPRQGEPDDRSPRIPSEWVPSYRE